MQAPMILPWVASKAGLSEELTLKLWRRAAGEAEIRLGNHNSPEYHQQVMQHFLALVEAEAETAHAVPCRLDAAAPRLTALWHQQRRITRLSLLAAEQACRCWQETWKSYCGLRQAA